MGRSYLQNVMVFVWSSQVPVITALEQRMLSLLKRRADELMERRRQDVRDQAEELAPSMAVSQYLGPCSRLSKIERACCVHLHYALFNLLGRTALFGISQTVFDYNVKMSAALIIYSHLEPFKVQK